MPAFTDAAPGPQPPHAPHPHPPLPPAAATGADWRAGFARRTVAKGGLIATPGDGQDFVLMVESGRVRVYLADEDKELSLAYLEAGELFSTHTGAFLRADRPTVLLTMPTARFGQVLVSNPAVTPLIMRVLGRLLKSTMERVEDLAFRDVAGRLARFLTHAAERRGHQLAEGGVLIALDLSTEDIALLLGTTRQTVSSLINRMARQGILRRAGRGSLHLLRPEALADWTG